MPNDSAVIVLAGHGAYSEQGTIVKDSLLLNHSIVFPAKLKGQLCFVAHNIILESIIRSDSPSTKLGELETYHGFSTVRISRGENVLIPYIDLRVDLRNVEHRQQLTSFLQNVKSIQSIRDHIEATNLSDMLPDILDPEKLSLLQVGIFEEVNICALFNTDIIKPIIQEISKLLHTSYSSTHSCMLLEHALGSWEKSLKQNPWQQEMPYSPTGNYEFHYLTSLMNKELITKAALKVYIDKTKLHTQIIHTPNTTGDVAHIVIDKTHALYVTTSAEKPVLRVLATFLRKCGIRL